MTKVTSKYCSAINCSKSRRKNPELSFFRFPKDEERSKAWLEKCRRQDIMEKSMEQLSKLHCLCADHFEDCQFVNWEKKRLKWKAVPTLFNFSDPPKSKGNKKTRKKLLRMPEPILDEENSSEGFPEENPTLDFFVEDSTRETPEQDLTVMTCCMCQKCHCPCHSSQHFESHTSDQLQKEKKRLEAQVLKLSKELQEAHEKLNLLKVCELQIQKTVSTFDDKTEETANLTNPRLVEGSIPSQSLNCPKSTMVRKSSGSRKVKLENKPISVVILDNIEPFEQFMEKMPISSLEDLKAKLSATASRFPKDWVVLHSENCVGILLFNDTPKMDIICSVQINQDLVLSVFNHNLEVQSLPNIRTSLPTTLNSLTEIEEIVNECDAHFSSCSTDVFNVHDCVKGVLSYLDRLEDLLERSDASTHIDYLKKRVSLIPLRK